MSIVMKAPTARSPPVALLMRMSSRPQAVEPFRRALLYFVWKTPMQYTGGV
jgi:hypothetical protein